MKPSCKFYLFITHCQHLFIKNMLKFSTIFDTIQTVFPLNCSRCWFKVMHNRNIAIRKDVCTVWKGTHGKPQSKMVCWMNT